MSWKQTVSDKISELEMIASWASQTNLGRVRDYCRMATAELKHELKRMEEQSDVQHQR